MSTLELPFAIGDTFWEPITSPRHVTVPCPICSGKKMVTVELGTGERLPIECDACGLGYQGAKGVVYEWEIEPGADAFIVAEIEAFQDGQWSVRSATGQRAQFSRLCATEAEARAISETAIANVRERNMESRQHRRKNMSKAAWTIHYHRSQIKDLERRLAWHRGKLNPKAPA